MKFKDLKHDDKLIINIKPYLNESEIYSREWLNNVDHRLNIPATFRIIGRESFTSITAIRVEKNILFELTGINVQTESYAIYLSATTVIINQVNSVNTKIDLSMELKQKI
ncbi:hypothetical protein [Photobacterium kishitanii]|uniref:hypothetical protein n=1 Tax=Photobacterium kishitanii TaxID=318456 RepID=UPI0007F9104F|nr:hypothetical protein [Photobacterium kishitanii]OBU31202.1 hypothetical protein AYY23_20025 [Photobacterium kishitanii]PSW46889.1 hypothetical protein C0W66_21120 [Photobacterium kishitanii]